MIKLLVGLALISLLLCLLGCSAQQWQTSKQVMALALLGGIAVIATEPPVVTTRCQTVAHGNTVKTVCATY